MGTTLGRDYPLDWRGDPAHMLKSDIPVWYRYLDLHKEEIIALYYDCLLGGEDLSTKEEQDPFRRAWKMLTGKRADVIAETEKEVQIIEVTSEIGMRAVGQLQVYRALWLQDPKIAKIERLIIVGSHGDKLIGQTCRTIGIDIVVV